MNSPAIVRFLSCALSPIVLALFAVACGEEGTNPKAQPDPDGSVQEDANNTPVPDAAVPDAEVPDPRPERYPADRTHSPLTDKVKAKLEDIRDNGNRADAAFIKVGDSITESMNFLACFSGDDVDFDGNDDLEQTRDYFAATTIGDKDSFDRDSLAAEEDWQSSNLLEGASSPVTQELTAVNPRFAVVMVGTNNWAGSLSAYTIDMFALVDQLVAYGTIPVLSSLPPLPQDGGPVWVTRANAVLRGIAEARQIPFVDYYREMDMLADDGIGDDDIHPTVYNSGGAKACVLDETGLAFGYNVRNLVTLEALDRVRRVAVLDADAPDDPALHLDGVGTAANPYVIPSTLPFTHVANTANSTQDAIDAYAGCAAAQNESGPEIYYKITVAANRNVRFFVLDGDTVDIDLHLLNGAPTAAACTQRNDLEIGATLTAGDWYLSLDTFVTDSEKKGEYLLVVLPE